MEKNPACHAYSPKPKNYPVPKRGSYFFGGITVGLIKYYGLTYKSHPSFVTKCQGKSSDLVSSLEIKGVQVLLGYLLHSSSYGAVFQICDQNSVKSTLMF